MDNPIFRLEKVVRAKSEALEDFEGPLDLILHLLGKNKIEIADIQISLILDQYLEWMARRKELDLEVASDFVAMASHLVYIKARMLISERDEEVLTEMDLLIRSLEERRRGAHAEAAREAAKELARREEFGVLRLVKGPEPRRQDGPAVYSHTPEDLEKAMSGLFQRAAGRLPPPVEAFDGIVGREVYPVTEKAMEILSRLASAGKTAFRALFRGSRTRSEIVATFLAVLELCRSRAVLLTGGEGGTGCSVERREAAEGGPESPEETA